MYMEYRSIEEVRGILERMKEGEEIDIFREDEYYGGENFEFGIVIRKSGGKFQVRYYTNRWFPYCSRGGGFRDCTTCQYHDGVECAKEEVILDLSEIIKLIQENGYNWIRR